MSGLLPLISVITVVYNGEKHIEQCINSVLAQTYPNIEYIVIDGGSSDSTRSIIEKYASEIDFFLSEKDQGIYDAMNKGIKNSNGDYIIFMNADDFFYNEEVIALIDFGNVKNNMIDIVYGRTNVIDDGHCWIVGKEVDFLGLSEYAICHQSVFVSKECYLNNGMFNLGYKIASDYEFFVKSFSKGAKSLFYPLIISSIREGGVSTSNLYKTVTEKLAIFRAYYSRSIYYSAYFKTYLQILPRHFIRMFLKKVGVLKYLRVN